MRYATAKATAEAKLTAYRIYVSDALKVIGENTARFASGTYLTRRYADVVNTKKPDTRTGEEIVADIIKKAGLVVKTNESI